MTTVSPEAAASPSPCLTSTISTFSSGAASNSNPAFDVLECVGRRARSNSKRAASWQLSQRMQPLTGQLESRAALGQLLVREPLLDRSPQCRCRRP